MNNVECFHSDESLAVCNKLNVAVGFIGSISQILSMSRWVALTESMGSLFPAPTGSATESTGILLMKLAMKATSAEDFFEKKVTLLYYSISRDPEHIRHTTFVQKTAVRDTEPVQKRYFSPPCMSTG